MEHAAAPPEAAPLCPGALLHLGSRAAVDQAPSRRARSCRPGTFALLYRQGTGSIPALHCAFRTRRQDREAVRPDEAAAACRRRASGATFGKGAPLSRIDDYPHLSERADPSAVAGIGSPDASLEDAFYRMKTLPDGRPGGNEGEPGGNEGEHARVYDAFAQGGPDPLHGRRPADLANPRMTP